MRMWVAKPWPGRDLQSQEEQDAGSATRHHRQGTQRLQNSSKTMTSYKGEPRLGAGHQPCGPKKHGFGDQSPEFESQICYYLALWLCTSYLLLSASASSSGKWRQYCLPLRMALKTRGVDVYQVPSQHVRRVLSIRKAPCLVLPSLPLTRFLTKPPIPKNWPKLVTGSWECPGQSGWRGIKIGIKSASQNIYLWKYIFLFASSLLRFWNLLLALTWYQKVQLCK